jgi:hypothetical protein
MRNRPLHDALRDFALEAAALLTDELRGGAELEFDVVDERVASGPVLYRYRPLVGAFIEQRWPALRELPACPRACAALGDGAASYLRVNGLPGEAAEPALRALLERLYEDATSFGFPEERFERVYAEVEDTLYRDALRSAIVAPLRGLDLKAPRVELGSGLSIARPDGYEAPPELLLAVEPDDLPGALLVLERFVPPDDRAIEAEARMRFARTLTGLRLWAAGAVGLGSLAWRQIGEGRWRPLPIAGSPARGEPWKLLAGEEGALAAFLQAIESAERPGSVAWALNRFELGCSRPAESDALSDYLLALAALLDATGEAGRASLPPRLAALCAEESERPTVQRRAELALSLERFLMEGGSVEAAELRDWIGPESPHALVAELEHHLRALLRDVLCGYLEPELGLVADDILLEVPDPPDGEIDARDLRAETPEPEPMPEPEEPGPEPEPVEEPDPVAEQDTSEIEALPQLDLEDEDPRDGVTSSVDWDEDPESYSAPV